MYRMNGKLMKGLWTEQVEAEIRRVTVDGRERRT